MKRLPRGLLWGLVLAATLAVVLVAVRAATVPKATLPGYQTATLDRGPISAKVTANGTLSALVMVNVGSQVSGRIESLRSDFGSKVTRGQIVATIEPSLFRAAAAQASANYRAALAGVERAKAQTVNAERQYDRAKALHQEGLATGADFDTAQASLDVARADLAVARSNVEQARAARDQSELNLHYTTIVSPIDGVVISRNVDVGQTVAATLQAPTLFAIAEDLTRMQVDTNVSEADVGKIREGMNVTFTVDSYPTRSFQGTIRQVRDNAQTIQNVVTYDAVVDVSNDQRLLRPGMTASVTFTYAEKADVVRIPSAALRFRPDTAALSLMQVRPQPAPHGDERTLWLLRAGRAVPASVHVGISDGTTTELVSGHAEPGDAAILELKTDTAKRAP
ncbi:MAG TPA: efflux RND transporter periplasmic adaptor subunit [Polyangiaceae bacterium]